MKIRAGKKLWRRKPMQAPAMIAERIAGSILLEREGEDDVGRRRRSRRRPAARPSIPSRKLTMFITATIQTHRQRHADRGGQVDDAEEREREVVDPDAEEAAGSTRRSTWPASFRPGFSTRKSSIAPTTVATAAPSSTPRVSRPSSRNASAGTKIPKKIASPPSRGTGLHVQAPPPGLVDDAEQPRHAADRGRQQDDDQQREQRSRREPRDGRAARPSVPRLLRAVEPVACVAEARHDVALLVQLAVDRGADDVDVRDAPRARARSRRAPRRCRRASPSARRRPSPPRPPRRSSCRSRASGRARSRRARPGPPAASRSTRPARASPRRGRGR